MVECLGRGELRKRSTASQDSGFSVPARTLGGRPEALLGRTPGSLDKTVEAIQASSTQLL